MPRRYAHDLELADLGAIPPIDFEDRLGWNAPVFEVGARRRAAR